MTKLGIGQEPFSVIRRLALGTGFVSLGLNLHHNASPTNPDKVWNRYAGGLVLRGRGEYTDWAGRRTPIGPGDFVHHLPGRYHHITREPAGWDEFSLVMDADLFGRLAGLGLVDDSRGVWPVGAERELSERFGQFRAHLEKAAETAGGALCLEAGALLWRIRELAGEAAPAPALQRQIESIRERLAQDYRGQLSLARLAAETGISYDHFRRRFREQVGQAPGSYRNEQRLEQARLLLGYQRIRVGEVAARLGYADPFVFSRQFKRRFGVSPKGYARSQLQQ